MLSQKSWNFLPFQNKILEFSPSKKSQIPWQIGIPGIFWSHNFPSCNFLSGNFLSWNFVSRKIHGFIFMCAFCIFHFGGVLFDTISDACCYTNFSRPHSKFYLDMHDSFICPLFLYGFFIVFDASKNALDMKPIMNGYWEEHFCSQFLWKRFMWGAL